MLSERVTDADFESLISTVSSSTILPILERLIWQLLTATDPEVSVHSLKLFFVWSIKLITSSSLNKENEPNV